MKRPTKVKFFAIASFMVVTSVAAITLAVAQPQTASAAVGEGGERFVGGGPGPFSSYMFGWRVFGISEPGPWQLANGGTWSSVQAACQADNANQIVAFIIYPTTLGVTSAIVYTEDFTVPYPVYEGYTNGGMQWGGSAFPWRDLPQVRDMFDTLPAHQKVGQVLGGANGTVGWFCYDPTQAEWIPTPVVEFRVQSGGAGAWGAWQSDTHAANVGDRVEFRHRIVNTGAVATTRTVNGTPSGSSLMPSGATPGNFTLPLGTINGGATPWQQGDAFFVLNSMVGAGNICQNLSVTPTGPTGNNSTSTQACFTVRHNPQLTPNTTTSTEPIYPGITTIHVTSTLNSSGTTNGDETKVGLARFVVKNGQGYDDTAGSGRTMTDISDGYTCRLTQTYIATETPQRCDRIREETYPPNALPNASSLSFYDDDNDISALLDDLEFGDRVCYVTVVNRYGAGIDDTTWRHSRPACRIVAKVPTIQISGNDLTVRGTAGTDTNRVIRGVSYVGAGILPTERISYGSWAEYGVFGPSSVDMHSGGALAHAIAEVLTADKNYLTFANTGTGTPGGFSISGAATVPAKADLAKLGISSTPGAAPAAITDIAAGTEREYTGSAAVQLSGDTNLSGTRVLRATNSTVHISSNIEYADTSPTNLANLPQVIIIAQNITIADTVTQIDAQLFATGYINTCKTETGPNNASSPSPSYFTGLTSDVCNSKLRINGIVQTGRLFLRRTAGAEGATPTDRHQPAEVFNGRSDAYLWQYGRAAAQSVIRTEGVRELPPRF